MSTARRFFLRNPPDEQGRGARLSPEDEKHASLVLRLGPGDPLWGLDGKGRAWPLVVVGEPQEGRPKRSRAPLELALRTDEPARHEPAPGEPGAALPWIELSCALPKGGRAVEMVERLTQLGLARLNPITFERSSSEARGASESRLEKLRRAAREACKQSFRLTPPEIAAIATYSDTIAANAGIHGPGLLDPQAEHSLLGWAAGSETQGPWHLIVGPEGGFSERELAQAREAGATPLRLGPHILRIETAAEAATAALVLATGK